MRALADAERIHRFMDALGRAAREDGRVYFTGGATAVLSGWRSTTVAVDLALVPEQDAVLRAIPALKESLQLNVELASPADFIPVPPNWEARSPFIAQAGRLAFHHFDLYAQALAKVERGHAQDVIDVRELLHRGLVEPPAAWRYFERIEPELYRFPALDPAAFRRAMAAAFGPDSPEVRLTNPRGFMDQDQLHQRLAQLHAELVATKPVDAETRDRLEVLARDIRAVLDAEPKPASVEPYQAMGTRLKEAVASFEASHPQLSKTIENVIETLSLYNL